MNKKTLCSIENEQGHSLVDLERSSLDLQQLSMDVESSTFDHIISEDAETREPTITDFNDTSYSESENCNNIQTDELTFTKEFNKCFFRCISIGQFINRSRKANQNISNSEQVNTNYPTEEPLLENCNKKNIKKDETHSKKHSIAYRFGLYRKFSSYFQKQSFQKKKLNYRIIYLNNRFKNAPFNYCNNYVSTTKYNIATFLPKFLFEQFSKYANLFFLFTSCIQQIHNISPTNRWTTIGPLIVVLLISAFKELIEDFKRRSQDKELNQSEAYTFEKTSFIIRKWVNICVGDIVRVESGQIFPADLVLISSSEPEGLCYIETSNLDGETNLKIKQSLPETSSFISHRILAQLSGEIHSEHPNNSLYTYEATIILNTDVGKRELPLTADQLLLRGAFLRNTSWIYGVVVFTGHETKLMKNTTSSHIKQTAIEKIVNIQIIFLFCMLIVLSLASSIGLIIKQHLHEKNLGYLYLEKKNKVKTFFLNILTFCVLYSNLVPISLFVTIELVKYAQAQLINNDLDMYYERDDIPTICRTSNLVEELGQVEYIFTDKTGTLTCNQMEFCKLSIAGISYMDNADKKLILNPHQKCDIFDFKQLNKNLHSHKSKNIIHNALILLATCHTVIPEKIDGQDDIIYQAASPDEGALVKGAAKLGYIFTKRRPRSVFVSIQGEEHEFRVLNICEFNSSRKRMSVILLCPDGKIRLYCKGADTVILERLSKNSLYSEKTLQHLEDYAISGLRTLCLAMREISEKEYQEWSIMYDEASTSINNRTAQLDKVSELIEKELFLLGATAIEDKLQDGVPETIHTLQLAGIKVWVLTGDHKETAINVGISCKLITEDMNIIIINGETKKKISDYITKKLKYVKNKTKIETETLALIIDGYSLAYALEKDIEKKFINLAVLCRTVICCRASPLQKALVVTLIKKHLKATLLAIGDGSNDISMIQAANVGIGISGTEGLQAARSADIAIGQFRYLKKLLLVHGAWSYQRLSKLILYSFYKNISLHMTQFWYAFNNGFSGQVIFESWTISFYNVFFTFLPPIAIGVFDQFLSARLLNRYPQLYKLGQFKTFFNVKSFWSWIANGFYHSLILYFTSKYIFKNDLPQADGKIGGHWVWGTTLYATVLATVLGKAALIINSWTTYTILAIPGSFIIWLTFLPIYTIIAPKLGISVEYYGINSRLYTSLVFWATILILPTLCLLRDFAWKYYKRSYYPQAYHRIQEIQKLSTTEYKSKTELFQKTVRKVRNIQRISKLQRGYAFSQGDSGQTKLIRAYDTTRERGKYEVEYHQTPE
ncbi:uncharacterized protein T551_02891 [Pneumocystis jirovecii RU7]|uniref:Phospholipid-transporting ATPase n=1 Tax=Pneumocystis jirovecii (strain RU7) TaxID=1408657 RepID=A0A0W4ZHT8_PNEJ7|nr:uncharacterized protein T551_02891 [Pneumocystis jirovecii RU7]KTW27924.1 hypothetical protein T551_02891 [Pneumocystis jirovecii RU7]